MKRTTLFAALLLLPACSTAPQKATAPAPKGMQLSYVPLVATTATYTVQDSTIFDIRGGAIGDIHATSTVVATTVATYAARNNDLEVTMRVTSLAGSGTNSASGGGGPRATEADIEGPAVLTVTPRGAVTVTTMPKLTPAIGQLGVSQSFFRRFFVRLPSAAVRPGAVWVDTISVTDENAGTRAALNDVVTSTFVRDTVVNGRTLAFITTSSQRTLSISGQSQGVEIVQKLTGTGTGTVLWDIERKLLVDRAEKAELSGTFDLPAMGVTGLPVTGRGAFHIAQQQ